MGRHFKIVVVCALFLTVVSLPASAGSIYSFSNLTLTGNSGSSASGSFGFDSSTHTFSSVSMSFSGGAFNNIWASSPGGKGVYIQGQGYLFSWGTTVHGDLIWCSILFNPANGQFREWGGIANWKDNGKFDYMGVPEGGAELTYLMLAGIAVFGGILTSGKRRRITRSSQSN
jgi:hypothetical protein